MKKAINNLIDLFLVYIYFKDEKKDGLFYDYQDENAFNDYSDYL